MSHLPESVALKSFFSQPLQNFAAGATVAIVALPLALAFGIGSGLGAAAGLTTAIIAGLVAAVFGGSKYQVSGPTGAMTVVLIPIFSQYGAPGVLGVGLIAGGLLILLAILRIGQHVHKLPTALIEGFTAGIAIVIAISQLQFLIDFNSSISALVIAVAVVLASRKIPRLPISLILVIVAAVLNSALNLELTSIGELPARIGDFSIGFLSQDFTKLVFAGIAVAILAALESLLSAKIADRMALALQSNRAEKSTAEFISHDSNRELFGQGLANLIVPFFGGVPATAALARTAVNVKSGATSKLASAVHALLLAVIVLTLAPLVSQIPLAALAGVLFATCFNMINFGELRSLAKESVTNAAVLAVTFIVTVSVDLIAAVISGLVVSLTLRHRKIADNLDRRYPPVNSKETLGD
ncbi:MAG: hypothetical protein RI933_255 [Actinomycetota bacterium]